MVTFTGMQSDLTNALTDLVELEYDALEAYKAAIGRLENKSYKVQLREFEKDHIRHIRELKKFLTDEEVTLPKGPGVKQWLAKGKTVLAGLIGDTAILYAMHSNEVDTNTAYDRIVHRDDLNHDLHHELKSIINHGYDDEKRHKKWIEDILEND